MNLYTGDLDVIKKEIKNLELELRTEKDRDRIVGIVSTIELLIELYNDVSSKTPKSMNLYKKTNKKKVKISDEIQKKDSESYIKNFIDNKSFHGLFVNDLYYNMSRREEELFSISEDVKLSYKEMYDIMMGYLSEEGLADSFNKLLKEKRIFKGLNDEFGYAGYTTHNTINNTCCILIMDDDSSVITMRSIIHELGHVIDFTNLNNTKGFTSDNEYYLKSIYNEVFPMLMEKNFLSYLLRNNIYNEDASSLTEDYYYNIIESLKNLLVLSSLDDKLLVGDAYINLDPSKLMANVRKNNKDIVLYEDIIPSELDIHNDLVYGYGGILSIYYNYLKESDPDKYNFYKERFLENRANSFNIKEFSRMFSDYGELEENVLKKMDDDIKIKMKVYHEN